MACKNGHLDVVEALLQAAKSQYEFCLRKGLPSDLHIALNARTKKVCCGLCLVDSPFRNILVSVPDPPTCEGLVPRLLILLCVSLTSLKCKEVIFTTAG